MVMTFIMKHLNPSIYIYILDLFFSLPHLPAGDDGMMLRRGRDEQLYMTRPEMLAHALWHKETYIRSLRAHGDKRGGRQRAAAVRRQHRNSRRERNLGMQIRNF